MSRILLGLALLVPVASFAQEPSADAVDESAPPAKGWRSSEGFQAARWGMTKAEVRKLFPKAKQPPSEDMLIAPGKVDRIPATIGFLFVLDRLSAVSVQFAPKRGSEAADEYGKLVELLTSKYGEPSNNKTKWESEAAETVYASLDIGTAIALGHASMTAKWQLAESTIIAACLTEGRARASASVLYSSPRLEPAREELARRKAVEDL